MDMALVGVGRAVGHRTSATIVPDTVPFSRSGPSDGVSDGTRTRDILDHNQGLYQLSYTHHARGPKCVSRTTPRSVKCTGRRLGEA